MSVSFAKNVSPPASPHLRARVSRVSGYARDVSAPTLTISHWDGWASPAFGHPSMATTTIVAAASRAEYTVIEPLRSCLRDTPCRSQGDRVGDRARRARPPLPATKPHEERAPPRARDW